MTQNISSELSVGIVGVGVVGKATARAYADFREVRCWDVLPRLSTHTLEQVMDCGVVFVCLPEMIVEQFVMQNCVRKVEGTYVIRSTVPVGTTKRLAKAAGLSGLIHSPEFLTERTAHLDSQLPSQLIVGRAVTDETIAHTSKLANLYRRRFPGTQVRYMDSDDSELLKLVLNAFFCTKIAFFNEVESLCRRLGVSYDVVREGVLGDGRVTAHHTQVPGPDGRFGFGGKCLPKDLDQLLRCFSENGARAPVLNAVKERNDTIDRARP